MPPRCIRSEFLSVPSVVTGIPVVRPQRGTPRAWAWALSACLVAACSGGDDDPADTTDPPVVSDSTGARFEQSAESADALRSIDDVTIECGGKLFTSYKLVRGETGLAMVCAVDPSSGSNTDFLCRPVACAGELVCPDGSPCNPEGLCQPPGVERIHSLELMARCLAGVARPRRCLDAFTDPSWGMVSQVLLDECDGEGLCSIPELCR